jgi:hypothetical protein
MGISNQTTQDNEVWGKKRPENPAQRRRRLEKSLESGLEDTFPASDAISIVQPPPTVRDGKKVTAGQQGQ